MITHPRMSPSPTRRTLAPAAVIPAPTGRALPLLIVTALSLTFFGCSGAPESGEQAQPGAQAGQDAATEPTGSATQPEVLIPAPEFADLELRNQNDEVVIFEELRGKPTLLAFIYTRCPMPMMCPATMLRFQEVQKELSEEQRARVQLITVSFDPANDTPAVLAEFGELWDADTSFWSLLTGSEENIRAVASAYGAWYEQTEDGNFDHPMYSMILFPDGALHEILRGSMWSSKEAARKLVDMAAASTPTPH